MEPIELTPQQIAAFDELTAERDAIEKTMTIALQFCENRLNKNRQDHNKLWEELADIHKLGLSDVTYVVKRVNFKTCIAVKDEDKGNDDEEEAQA